MAAAFRKKRSLKKRNKKKKEKSSPLARRHYSLLFLRAVAVLCVTKTIAASLQWHQNGMFLFSYQQEDDTPVLPIVNKPVLWLVACNTNPNNHLFDYWNSTARHFRDYNPQNAAYQQDIHIRNVCEGKPWEGYMTKFLHVRALLQDTIVPLSNTTATQRRHLVLFMDADGIFNSYAMSMPQVVQRFDQARHDKPLLASAEPGCWFGLHCRVQDYQTIYPDVHQSSKCPQYVNSGQYMAEAADLLPMLTDMLDQDHNEIAKTIQPRRLAKDDQFRMALYRAQHPHHIQLDTTASVFRNSAFGLFDPNNTQKPWIGTCGPDTMQRCGRLQPMSSGYIMVPPSTHNHNNNNHNHNNASSTLPFVVEMEPIDGCPAESRPFAMHYSGPYVKRLLAKLHQGIDQQTKNIRTT